MTAAPAAPADLLIHAPAAPTLRARATRSKVGIAAVILLVAFVALQVAAARPSDYTPLSTNNTATLGTRALAQILRDHNVDVRQVDRLADAHVRTPGATTLVIAAPSLLTTGQLTALADYPGDIVLLGASTDTLAAFDVPATEEWVVTPSTVSAACDDADALAAQEVTVAAGALAPTDATDGELCFVTAQGSAGLARVTHAGRTVSILAATNVVTNDELDLYGHAALALRLTGSHPSVVWYVADGFDPSLPTWSAPGHADAPSQIEVSPDFLPPGTGSILYALALAMAIAAVWRGRRFGALVVEPLPVVVRASEATRGRARLYRRARATGRAGAALRAAACMRMGKRLGIPRSADPITLSSAVSRATGRPSAQVHALLFGPPPATESALLDLIESLDQLESEVHHP